jgi:hypothetical protein
MFNDGEHYDLEYHHHQLDSEIEGLVELSKQPHFKAAMTIGSK